MSATGFGASRSTISDHVGPPFRAMPVHFLGAFRHSV
jgi:hypothetical protein